MKTSSAHLDTLPWLLDRIIRSAERHEVLSPSVQVGRVLLTAVAAAALREALATLEVIADALVWVAMSCKPREPSSWQAALPIGRPSAEWGPIPFSLPEQVSRLVVEKLTVDGDVSDRAAMLIQIHAGSDTLVIPQFPAASRIYLRQAEIELPDPHGTLRAAWIIGAGQLRDAEASRIDNALMRAERVVGDRLIHGLGSYKPLTTLLASIDDVFWESLRSARSAAGLNAFLDGLVNPQAVISSDPRSADAEPASVDKAKDSELQATLDSGAIRRCIVDHLRSAHAASDNDSSIKVAKQGRLKTPFGDWHAYAEIGYGLVKWSTRAVLVEVCERRDDVEFALAAYFSREVREKAHLLILLGGKEAALHEQHARIWQQVKGVSFAVLR